MLCVPVDRRMPKLRLRSSNLSKLVGQRFVVRLDKWDASSFYPSCHLIRILGPIDNVRWNLALSFQNAWLSEEDLSCKICISAQKKWTTVLDRLILSICYSSCVISIQFPTQTLKNQICRSCVVKLGQRCIRFEFWYDSRQDYEVDVSILIYHYH